MRSNAPVEPLPVDFLDLTPDAIEFLQQMRDSTTLGPHEYLEFLLAFAPNHRPTRDFPDFREPFEL